LIQVTFYSKLMLSTNTPTLMKRKLLPFALVTLFVLLLGSSCFSQDLDLIVNSKGDSIACRIDSITDTHVYFTMKFHNNWIPTSIVKEEVTDYMEGVIQKKEYTFEPGTSIIASSSALSMYDVLRNSMYIGIFSINYARMFPVGQATGITTGGGITFLDGPGIVLESSVLLGGAKHFGEFGIMWIPILGVGKETFEDWQGGIISIRAGYRYQGPGGLLFRLGLNVASADGEIIPLPALSIGYSF